MSQPNKPENPLIAICMATYNPQMNLFEDQIKSIIAQSHKNWICIINDDCSDDQTFEKIRKTVLNDKRFLIYQNHSRLGFYYNFEQCLKKVPKNVELVAFADQDDFWHQNKLSTCVNEFDLETTLVYSDMNIVTSDGKLISNTYWKNRHNNYEKLVLLLFANTITGAASLFRRKILDKALPFPEKVGDSYHDWWIGCIALSEGKIKFINKPLYDYRQHEGTVLGHFSKKPSSFWKFILNPKFIGVAWNNYAVFVNDFVRVVLVANTLKQRCLNAIPEKRKIICEVANYEQSIFKLFFRFLMSKFRRKAITLGAEQRLLQSYIITKYYTRHFKKIKPQVSPKQIVKEEPQLEDMNSTVYSIQQKIAPLKIKISPTEKKRINLLIPTIDFQYFFGGYITKFNLAKQLALQGHDVRIIIVDWCDFNPNYWKNEIRHYTGLEDFFEMVEVNYAFDRSKPITFNDNDIIIATTWWTAHIANDSLNYLNKKKFIYLIQEYEPFTFALGTYYALAKETYNFPHYAIFSTEFLREYFKRNRIGVFKNDPEIGEKQSFSFKNAITEIELDKEIPKRKKKKLLFYARPEQHASRNMFEIGIIALSNAIKNDCFNPSEWEFHGIGSIKQMNNITLPNNLELKIHPRTSQEEYKKLLPSYDLGLSLMYTPHPNLVTIEMASAGMIVVTNSFENKNQDSLSNISSNIIVAIPTITDIEKVLCKAVKLSDDYEKRFNGSKVNWPSNWKDSFNSEFFNKIRNFYNEK